MFLFREKDLICVPSFPLLSFYSTSIAEHNKWGEIGVSDSICPANWLKHPSEWFVPPAYNDPKNKYCITALPA